MGEIVIKLKVPDWMEKDIKQKVKNFVREELSKKRLNQEILRKYAGVAKGKIDEEEWYLQ